MNKRLFLQARCGLALTLFSICVGLTPAAVMAQDDSCETCCEDDCGAPRCSLGYSIARHLKLQSVYAFRKICRPYRRMAGTPEQLSPWVEPVLPYQTDPFTGPTASAAGFGGGAPTYAPGISGTGAGGWATQPGYDSFGSSYRYTPSGPAIRYNSAP